MSSIDQNTRELKRIRETARFSHEARRYATTNNKTVPSNSAPKVSRFSEPDYREPYRPIDQYTNDMYALQGIF